MSTRDGHADLGRDPRREPVRKGDRHLAKGKRHYRRIAGPYYDVRERTHPSAQRQVPMWPEVSMGANVGLLGLALPPGVRGWAAGVAGKRDQQGGSEEERRTHVGDLQRRAGQTVEDIDQE